MSVKRDKDTPAFQQLGRAGFLSRFSSVFQKLFKTTAAEREQFRLRTLTEWEHRAASSSGQAAFFVGGL